MLLNDKVKRFVRNNYCREDFTRLNVDERSEWDEIRANIMEKEAFMAVTEDQALKMFR